MEGCVVPPFCQGKPLDPLCLYQMQSNKDILLDIYSQSQFSHEDGKMSCEPIE
jgi:hypothetical protein